MNEQEQINELKLRVSSLESKVSAFERSIFRFTACVSAIGLALLIISGLTFLSIPERAKAAAEQKAEQIAAEYIDDEGGMKLLKDRAFEAAESAETAAQNALEDAENIQRLYDSELDSRTVALEAALASQNSSLKNYVKYGEFIILANKDTQNYGAEIKLAATRRHPSGITRGDQSSPNYYWRVIKP